MRTITAAPNTGNTIINGADPNAFFVTMREEPLLLNERVLSAGYGITIQDLGAGSSVIVRHDPNGISKTFTYTDGVLTGVSDSEGTKTLSYNSDGTLASIVGTGIYSDKTFTYSGGVLTAVTVS